MTGVNSYVGFAEEVTWGTFVPATEFLPVNSADFTFDQEILKSNAIIKDRYFQDQTQTALGKRTTGGSIEYPLFRGDALNVLLEHACGASTAARLGTVASPYEFTQASQVGKGLSITIAKPDTGGTLRIVGYAGCKIKSWSINIQAGSLATISFDFIGSSAEIVAAPSYAATLPSIYSFVHGALTVGGNARQVEALTISGDNALDDPLRLGSNDILQPLTVDNRSCMLEATVDFANATDLDTYLAAPAAQALVATMTAGNDILRVNANAILTGGGDPPVSGKGRIMQNLSFEAYENLGASTAAVTIEQWTAA